MSVPSYLPEIVALKRSVEETFGASLLTHNAFIALTDAIDKKLREHVSESTLERIWGYSTRAAVAISVRSLDVLSRYVGFATWRAFQEAQKGARESEEFPREGLSSAEILVGQRLRLGWLPDRLITVRRKQDGRFIIEESLHSSLRPGDSFECAWFQKGRPLYLDRFRRFGSDEETRYVAGEHSGLTTLELIITLMR